MTARVTRLMKALMLGVITAVGLFGALASGGGGGTPTDVPGNFHMTIKRMAGPNMLCPRTDVVWETTPGTLTGNNGINAPQQKSFAYAGGNTGGQSPFECNYVDTTLFTGLRAGTWTMKATTSVGGPTSISCTKTVSQGGSAMSFWTFDTTGKVISCS